MSSAEGQQRRTSWRTVWRAALLLSLCAATAVKLAVPPRLWLSNELAVPVLFRIEDGGGMAMLVAPGRSEEVRYPSIPAAKWQALTPSHEALAKGELLAGSFAPSGLPFLFQRLLYVRVKRTVNSRSGGVRWVAPLVSNSLAYAVTFSLIDSAGKEHRCTCVIEPGETKAFSGYFAAVPSTFIARTLDQKKVVLRAIVTRASISATGTTQIVLPEMR